ncbi:MAG: acetyl-CoA carboxylase biotin carboxylase subunit [Myxococcota bacterium]
MPQRFKRVLIANRGEIAVRIARTLREIGICPIAVYSDADRLSPHVRACDMAYHLGPSPANESYLRIELLLEVAKKSKADAIHPGYGFLSENAEFAEAVEAAGITFIGPSGAAMRKMGSKTAARDAMRLANVPSVPGSDGPLADEAQAVRIAEKIGFPIMLKASAGGGGKGMRFVESAKDVAEALRAARSEAENAFGDSTVYMEKAIVQPRHVEIQIMGGPDGRSIWLGERECSMQRRHQKVIEETPCIAIDETIRRAMGEVACRAADAVDYVGAGTVEFLLDADKNFYFLEMNTRLQVEHPITELCCGIDLVEAQVRVAEGHALPWSQEEIKRHGHAIEARIYAEDPEQNFLPSPGRIVEAVLPQGPGIRVDCGVASGFEVPRYYDPMIAKVIVWGEDRERARLRMDRALRETAFKGIKTNNLFLRHLLHYPDFIKGHYDTGTAAIVLKEPPPAPPQALLDVAVAAMVVNAYQRDMNTARQVATSEPSKATWRNPMWRMRGG